MFIDANVAIEGDLDLVRICTRREDEVILHVAVRAVIDNVDAWIDILIPDRGIMRNTCEPGLLRAAEEVVGVATQWVDPGALRGASSGEFHMRIVVTEGEDYFSASDVDR